jgi:hypothetical protein
MRLASRCPFVSNLRTILLYEGRGITQMDYLCGYLGVARGSELPRMPRMRTSPKRSSPKFGALMALKRLVNKPSQPGPPPDSPLHQGLLLAS